MTARVYEYGLLDPTYNAQLVADQMRAGHRYRNVLVEIERDRRTEVRNLLARHPDVEPLEAELSAARNDLADRRGQIRLQRKSTRTRSEGASMREAAHAAKLRVAEIRQRVNDAKAAIKEDAVVQAAIATADARAAERVRQARASCATYWGTYILHEADVARARASGGEVHFARWTGEGRVSAQIQGGIPSTDLAADTQVQIAPGQSIKDRRVPPNAKILRLRVQSDAKGKAIWAEWPMILHRPLPEEGRIKVVTVHKRRRDCRRWQWTVTFTVELLDGWTRGKCGEGAIALNLGYCRSYDHLKGAIRAGYLIDDLGQEREVIVPTSIIDRINKSEAIRSQRDKDVDTMRALLVAWLRDHEAILPGWIVDRTILAKAPKDANSPEAPRIWHITAWKSAARFRALAFAWRTARFQGDDVGYDLIERWRYRDEHLQRYEAGLLRGALLHRRDLYRQLAAELSAKYRTIVLHDTDLSDLQRSPHPEEDRREIGSAKYNQRIAAGSILRGALDNAFKRAGGEVVIVDDHRITKACWKCSEAEDWNQLDREHICGACGTRWDQDANACHNMLARERAGAEGRRQAARAAKTADRKETRSERLRRGLAAKRKTEAARAV